MTEKTEKPVFVLEGEVKYYMLDAPGFGEPVAKFDEKGKVTNGKLGVTILVEAGNAETEAAIKEIGKNGSIKSEIVNGKAFHKVTAKTGFKVPVADADGREIDAPTDVRVNRGDVMKVRISVSPFSGTYEEKDGNGTKTGKKIPYSLLNLNAAKILSHDTTNREEAEMTAEEGSLKESFLAAL